MSPEFVYDLARGFPRPPKNGAVQALMLMLALLLCSCDPAPGTHQRIEGETMGTSWSAQWHDAELDPAWLAAAMEARLEELNQSLSNWREDSEISRFNHGRAHEPMQVSEDLQAVLDAAQGTYEDSEGAFNIALAPLMRAWGFQGSGLPRRPEAAEVRSLLPRTDLSQLKWDSRARQLTKAIDELELDLSALAKGYAVDALSELLLEAGASNHLVEIGGELRARGHRPDGSAWRVAIAQPASLSLSAQPTVPLHNLAIATSGDYQQFFEQDGQRYAHILDPRNGRPARSSTASATVVAASAMQADALATWLMVLDTEDALALAQQRSLAVYLIERLDDGYRIRQSEAMRLLRDTHRGSGITKPGR